MNRIHYKKSYLRFIEFFTFLESLSLSLQFLKKSLPAVFFFYILYNIRHNVKKNHTSIAT